MVEWVSLSPQWLLLSLFITRLTNMLNSEVGLVRIKGLLEKILLISNCNGKRIVWGVQFKSERTNHQGTLLCLMDLLDIFLTIGTLKGEN